MKINSKMSFLKKHYVKIDNLCKAGGYRDGAYSLPYESIVGSEYLISGGVGSNAMFEMDCMDINPNIKMYLFDKSFSVIRMFLRSFYHFFKKNQNPYVSFKENFSVFSVLTKHKIVKKFLNSKYNISSILNEYNLNESKSIILKLDIEGSEYEILDSIIENKNIFSTLCIEFHGLNNSDNLFKLKNFCEKIGLDLVYISINESSIYKDIPSILELTFAKLEFQKKSAKFLQSSCSPGYKIIEFFDLN
jgi:hypothetical protein